MNAIELLKKDHRTVKSLFESFEKAKEQEDLDSKRSLFASIKQELEAHTRAEEEIFYPAFDQTAGEKDDDDKELVLEAGEEHQQVKTLLEDLSGMEPGEQTFDAKMKVMKDNVEHHVEEEESEMFPHAQKQLSSEELDQLGDQMSALKERIQQEGPDAGSPSRGRKSSRGGSRTRAASAPRRSGSSGGGSSSSSGRSKASTRSGSSKRSGSTRASSTVSRASGSGASRSKSSGTRSSGRSSGSGSSKGRGRSGTSRSR